MKPSFHRVLYFKDVSFQVRFLVFLLVKLTEKKNTNWIFFSPEDSTAASTKQPAGKNNTKTIKPKKYKMKTKWRRKRRRKKSCDVFV